MVHTLRHIFYKSRFFQKYKASSKENVEKLPKRKSENGAFMKLNSHIGESRF